MSISVEFTETELPGVYVVETPIFRDDRGFFLEAYSERTWEVGGLSERFVQDNLSVSACGTLRGLHYQLNPHGTGKLVRVISGSVFDVAVDLREGSPTFGRWVGQTLSDENHLAMWVPIGFAHGFLALENMTAVYYKCTHTYAPESERTISYKDPEIGIQWPVRPTLINSRDEAAPPLREAEHSFTFHDLGTTP